MPEKKCVKCGGTTAGFSVGRAQCKECLRKYYRAYHAANRTKHITYFAKHYRENKSVYRARDKVWKKANPEKDQASEAAYRSSHREQRRSYDALWKKNNAAKVRASEQRRRARIAMLEATLTEEQWLEILASFNHACAYCFCTDRPLTQEHVIPLSKGGGYTKDNIIPACAYCNSKKGDRPIWTML